ncbi:MAG: bifunctional phosphopantothenoylcysteine decarboxylase/phosphopantothenate--cysteine ligase CoaBC [Bacteroidota bacterium]
MLQNKKILMGITGGIAAYKMPLLVREFKKAGAEVRVVMTKAATEFINPITLATLSENDVVTDTFPDSSVPTVKAETWHIHLGTWADILLIAPATANTIAKIAYGIADNPVSIMALSIRCPVIISPAMDTYMWENPVTQENINNLQERGYFIINPEIGELASGLSGKGRLPEINKLIKSVDVFLQNLKHDMTGLNILITAGPTHEPIDPVRYIGNRSSGKMGFAIAKNAAMRGAKVTLVSGPSHLQTPNFVKRIDVETAEEMYNATVRNIRKADALIMAAAVADFTPTEYSEQKIKKEDGDNSFSLNLKRTKDILETIGFKKKENQVFVGFALETNEVLSSAKVKLKKKNLDLIVLNNPKIKGAGFGGDTNIVTIIHKSGKEENLPKMTKHSIANELLNRVLEFYNKQ